MQMSIRQTDLAKKVGISPAYLNLIEHDRRRIAGKILLDIAEVLEIEPTVLSEGAEAALISGLQQAQADGQNSVVEQDRTEEFASRFPGWAQLVTLQHREIMSLRGAVETLNDRISHDPFLSDAIHEILSTVTSIKSSASILVESEDIEKEWRDRFQRNIFEDSSRLSETSQSLVGYLDPSQDTDAIPTTPEEEIDRFMRARNYTLPELGETHEPSTLLADATEIKSSSARQVAQQFLDTYYKQSSALPAEKLGEIERASDSLSGMAKAAGIPLTDLMMRLAFRPASPGRAQYGYVVADASGAMLIKRPISGFSIPRIGQACPLWPVFQAFSRPLMLQETTIRQEGRDAIELQVSSIAIPENDVTHGEVPRFKAHMLLKQSSQPGTAPISVGVNCRICPKTSCSSRRESSILSDGF